MTLFLRISLLSAIILILATRSSTAELETGGLKNPVNVSNFTSTSNDSVPVNDLAKETADFIKSLDHEGLVSLFQIMVLQNIPSFSPSGRNPLVPVTSTSTPPTEGKDTENKSPLSGVSVMFQGPAGQAVLKTAETISKTQLGKYITQLHSYWKKANPDLRNQFRNNILKQIDGLNVPIGIQHAIQEVLPGLVAG